ncbi:MULTISPECIES: helix-turn-helix domain-containing protein [Cupriavidus]|jgi:HTH-type transcriptional regulator/antitoxin HipB|uniref:Helix-turn-helix domain-containing protein n=1 Tax=Cupriavidus pauculus TaxID=82633 RepID=A0A5P2HAT5_9BURK|nr:helix-turn-helix transcriptional regulator [Cupriavidus pauculus]QET05116.1 helix-turn-helix domain-containing protein [Cupriavidus pauculus]
MEERIATALDLGRVLQGARTIAGLSQAEAAARLNVSQSWISHMELNPETISAAQLLALMEVYELALYIKR